MTRLIGNNDKLFVRVQHESGQQATYTDPLSAAFDAHSAQPEWQSQLSETHTFGANKVNNFIASLQWYSALFTMTNPTAEFQTLPQTVLLGDNSLFPLNNEGTAFPQGRVCHPVWDCRRLQLDSRKTRSSLRSELPP
jgi:hypothetical protein